ncbi:MAG: hypothetical protein CFE26_24665 [Verrucomicrobiales bacterium VVV1]|nr:MAG: hypothetical protein CFE26_24665 [Verrucomicrobiales bacterium VVV1]
MGEGGEVDGLVAAGGGVLAVAGVEGDGTEIDELGVGVFAGLEIGLDGGGDFSAGLSGDGDHDDDLGFGAGAEAELGESGDDRFGFRSSVLAKIDEDDVGTGDELFAGEAGGGAGELVDEASDGWISTSATGPGVATEGEAGFAIAVVRGKEVAVAGAGIVGRGPEIVGGAALLGC